MFTRKANTQKQQAYDFYNSYEGDKVTRPTFYQRVRLGWDESREDKIRVKVKTQYRRREYVPRGKRAEQMIRYETQPEPKATKSLFRNRLNGWYCQEEAIQVWDKWMAIRDARKAKAPQQVKAYVPKRTKPAPVDESNFKIEITYPKEVAKAFRKEYVRMIEDIERELTYTEEKTQVAQMNEKLKRLYEELKIFNTYNR